MSTATTILYFVCIGVTHLLGAGWKVACMLTKLWTSLLHSRVSSVRSLYCIQWMHTIKEDELATYLRRTYSVYIPVASDHMIGISTEAFSIPYTLCGPVGSEIEVYGGQHALDGLQTKYSLASTESDPIGKSAASHVSAEAKVVWWSTAWLAIRCYNTIVGPITDRMWLFIIARSSSI